MPLRQATGFVESLLRLAGLDWKVPDFSTLCRRQKTLHVTIPFHGGSGTLHLLLDATEIKAEGEGEWNARKHGGPKKRLWRQLHLAMDEETLEIRAVGVTTSNVADAPMLPNLLDQIPLDQETATVTADGAYDTRSCHCKAVSPAPIKPPSSHWPILYPLRQTGRTTWRSPDVWRAQLDGRLRGAPGPLNADITDMGTNIVRMP